MTNKGLTLADKCLRIVEIEQDKFNRKGLFNYLLSYLLLLGGLYLGWMFGLTFWPSQIENKILFYFTSVVALTIFCQFLSFLMFLPGYLNICSFYEKYKINKRSSWPWQRPNWKQMRKKTILNFILNEIIISPLILFASTASGVRYRFTDFPSLSELVSQMLIVYFIEDTIFYWGHRILHVYPQLYKFHKVHHQYDKVYTFSTEYMHPVDLVLSNILPSALGFMVLGSRAHCYTALFWIFWKVLLGTEGHSGYEFPWSPMRVLPLVSGPSFHDHHHSMNVGCYAGSCYLWDVMLGTSEHYWKQYLPPVQQASK